MDGGAGLHPDRPPDRGWAKLAAPIAGAHPPEPGGAAYVDSLRGWPDRGFGMVSVSRYQYGDSVPRLIASEGEDWAMVPGGCSPSEDYSLFNVEDTMWFAWLDGDTVRWTTVGE